jgi:hypothetical protein
MTGMHSEKAEVLPDGSVAVPDPALGKREK